MSTISYISYETSRVLPLQEISIKLIVEHADDIESLKDFPAIVGEVIFSRIVSNGNLCEFSRKYDERLRIWKVFVLAYGTEILPTVYLSKKLLVLNEYLEFFLEVLPYVYELDVSYCSLGPSHKLISGLAHCERLQKLSLRKSHLSDLAIRMLTLRSRMYKKGLLSIEELDLSGNDLTDESIKWLCHFRNLKKLNLSGTKISENGFEMLKTRLSLYPCSETEFDKLEIKSSGWGKPLIDQWYQQIERKRRQRLRQAGPYGMCRGSKVNVSRRVTGMDVRQELEERTLLFMKHIVVFNEKSGSLEGLAGPPATQQLEDLSSPPATQQLEDLSSPPAKKKLMAALTKSIEKDLFVSYKIRAISQLC